MPLDPNYPLDTENVNRLPYWIRQVVSALASGSLDTNEQIVSTGDSELTGSAVSIEVIYVTANSLVEVNINTLTNGAAGRMKVLVFADALVTLIDATGNLNLRGDPALPDFPAEAGDVIGFVWDTDNTVWREMFRSLA